jgi:succinate-acetate transporter protein
MSAAPELPSRDPATDRTQVFLRPLAGPLTIGFLGLAGATFVVAGLNLGWVEVSEGRKVALCVLAFTVPLQALASVIGFLARDGVAASGMGMLAGIWLAQALVILTSPPGSTSDALGLFLLFAAVAMWAPASAAARSKLIPATVIATAGLRFALTGLYQLTASKTWEHAAGVLGLALALLAAYAAYAVEYEDVWKTSPLPLGRRGAGQAALTGSYDEQIANLHHEPGVRSQL